MLSKFLTYSTSGGVGSSGGLSPRNYERPWDRQEYNEFPRLDEPLHATFHATVTSPSESRSLWLEAEDDVALKKAIGCFMVLMMPEEGLGEAVDSLSDMLVFYRETAQSSLPPKPPSRQLTGRVSSVGKRPDLVIAD